MSKERHLTAMSTNSRERGMPRIFGAIEMDAFRYLNFEQIIAFLRYSFETNVTESRIIIAVITILFQHVPNIILKRYVEYFLLTCVEEIQTIYHSKKKIFKNDKCRV